MGKPLRFISAQEVHAALEWPVLVDGLREAFRRGGNAPVRHMHVVNETERARLLLMPAWREGQALGVKLVSVFPGNPRRGVSTVSGLYVLMDGTTGHPVALLDGEAITLRRTGAASALASTYLARVDSKTLLVVGTGRLAPWMAAAHCSARNFERVLVWGRSPEKARALAKRLEGEALPAQAVADLASAAAESDVITCATTARDPVLLGRWLKPGTHVDLVGAFAADMRESDDALVLQAEIVVDTFAGALKEAGDIVQPIELGTLTRGAVRAELADLVAGRHPGRTSPDQVTLFKSVGTALEDLCAAQLVVQRVAAL
jgi:ornithine cyclodeaminase/alanine dehydrogenase-like protein (mu-crystallin family)